jgi:hypothetical protein
MIKRIVEVLTLNGDDIGTVTTMYNCRAEETDSLDDAVQAVVQYRDQGFMNVAVEHIEIFTVH